MAIKIIDTVSQPPVHKPHDVNKPKAARDRLTHRRDWMRQRRVQDRVDAILLAQID
jgi:Rps23 Pro-64 3,4-dihydroxylase Tpa1-like proline 4-hydroxylase